MAKDNVFKQFWNALQDIITPDFKTASFSVGAKQKSDYSAWKELGLETVIMPDGRKIHTDEPEEYLAQGGYIPGEQSTKKAPTSPVKQVYAGMEQARNPQTTSQVLGTSTSVPEDYQQRIEQNYLNRVDDPNYYPAFNKIPQMIEAEKQYGRPGLAALLSQQTIYESGGGRESPNFFGALPGGEGAGYSPQFPSFEEALEYQLGPDMLGGGANPNMNILRDDLRGQPITIDDIYNLYNSYNPPPKVGPDTRYINPKYERGNRVDEGLLNYYKQITGF